MPKPSEAESLDQVVAEIRACRHCALPHEPRPVLQVSSTARLAIVGQAPGIRVHASGRPFTDPSGVRLREWMGVTEAEFYDASKVAILPMGFCFPGYDAKGADLPPRKECAPLWRERLMAAAGGFDLVLLVGGYAQRWHLGKTAKSSLTETVKAWRDYGPGYMPLPHPSWRNNAWLKKNSWFGKELLPELRRRVRDYFAS